MGCHFLQWIFLTQGWTIISCIGRCVLYHWATWEVEKKVSFLEKGKSKVERGITLHQSEWPSQKIKNKCHRGCWKKWTLPLWWECKLIYGEQWGKRTVLLKTKHRSIKWLSNPIPGHRLGSNQNFKRQLLPSDHDSTNWQGQNGQNSCLNS